MIKFMPLWLILSVPIFRPDEKIIRGNLRRWFVIRKEKIKRKLCSHLKFIQWSNHIVYQLTSRRQLTTRPYGTNLWVRLRSVPRCCIADLEAEGYQSSMCPGTDAALSVGANKCPICHETSPYRKPTHSILLTALKPALLCYITNHVHILLRHLSSFF